ncbi:MAG: terpene cyclase/mutase family protein [Planctomycetota bacterium]|nr:terpene cyclase/mutase family protein [Planctomycetota bacterium]
MAIRSCLILTLAALSGSSFASQSQQEPVFRSKGLTEKTRESIEKGLEYLRRARTEHGSIGDEFVLATTSLAGLAFLGGGSQYNRGEYGTEVRNCVKFVVQQWRPSGQFRSPGKSARTSQMHSQGYALLFLAEVYGMVPPEDQAQLDLKEKIQQSIKMLLDAQTRHGGWGYYFRHETGFGPDEASTTVCAIQALRACRNAGFTVDRGRVDRAIDYVKRCATKDGSFRYQVSAPERTSYELTAAAVATLNASGVYSSDELERGVAYMRMKMDKARNPGAAAKNFYYYGNFYAVQAIHQSGGDLWRIYYPQISEHIISKQQPKGFWENSRGVGYATAMAILSLELPLQYLPIFQR